MKKKLIALGLVGIVGVSALTGCASLDSAVKDHESEITGLDRVVTVYDHNGKVIREYEGMIRTKPSGGKDTGTNAVIFEVDGKRISLYNVDVVIEEK